MYYARAHTRVRVNNLLSPLCVARDCDPEQYSDTEYFIAVTNPLNQDPHGAPSHAFNQFRDVEAPGVDAGATGLDLRALVEHGTEHLLHVLEPVGGLLPSLSGDHGVTHEEQPYSARAC